MEVCTPSPLRTIYAQRTISLDSDVLRDLVPLYNLKNVNNTHGGVLLLVNCRLKAFIFSKSNIPPRVFFTFSNSTNGIKLQKTYQNLLSILEN